jgi:hypothetical protein
MKAYGFYHSLYRQIEDRKRGKTLRRPNASGNLAIYRTFRKRERRASNLETKTLTEDTKCA